MSGPPAAASPLVDWAVASRVLAGESACGDRHVVQPFAGGVLVAAIDGLGHGEGAALAALTCAHVLEQHPHESPISLVRRCHEALLGTRGVVLSLASFSRADATLAWIGVGNVEGVVLRADRHLVPARESLLLRGGVVGYQLPALSAAVIPVMPGDLLLFATDGVRSGYSEDLSAAAPVQATADRLLNRHAKGTDDALVLVGRFLGGGA